MRDHDYDDTTCAGCALKDAEIERLREMVRELVSSVERYETDPINAFDRPSSWQALEDVLAVGRKARTLLGDDAEEKADGE